MTGPETAKPKVLVAEDDLVSRRVLEVLLIKWGYEIIMVENGVDALACLQAKDSPRIAILDWMMPGLEGVEVCRRLRAQTDRPYVYVLLVSARAERDDMFTALGAGADDYLAKPFDSRELHARLIVGKRIVDLQDELIGTREALRFRATHDELTGTFNRGEILEAVGREEVRSSREGGCFAVAMIDIDHFKNVNDQFGHQTGDAVLQEVTRRISSCIRSYDMLGRYGGEEFLNLIPSTNAEKAFSLSERVRAAIAKEPISTPYGPVCITISVGVAVSAPGEPEDIDKLLREADRALYRAKANGRNRSELADSHDSKPATMSPQR